MQIKNLILGFFPKYCIVLSQKGELMYLRIFAFSLIPILAFSDIQMSACSHEISKIDIMKTIHNRDYAIAHKQILLMPKTTSDDLVMEVLMMSYLYYKMGDLTNMCLCLEFLDGMADTQ